MRETILAAVVVGLLWCAPTGLAKEPGWERGVVKFGSERERIQNTPLLKRPYRPLHFYGNTVRRLHYRGRALPAPRDVVGLIRTP